MTDETIFIYYIEARNKTLVQRKNYNVPAAITR